MLLLVNILVKKMSTPQNTMYLGLGIALLHQFYQTACFALAPVVPAMGFRNSEYRN